MFGAAATTHRFESSVGHIFNNGVFHLSAPLLFAADAALAYGDCVLSLPLVYLCVDDVGAGDLARCDVGFYGTNSWHPPILLIYHVSVQTIASS